MKQIIVAIFIAILTSLYIFPFNTVWLPAVNTKMALAVLGLIFFVYKGAVTRNAQVSLPMFSVSICALLVSLAGGISVAFNNTYDYSYASYFVSMWVWLGGAYVVVKTIEFAYGKVTIRMIGNFLIIVSVAQCVLAQIIANNAIIANLVDDFMVSTGFMGKVESRLYGIGCALDVAGLKFSSVLIMIAYFLANPSSIHRKQLERFLYVSAFLIIAVLGSMIARTTNVGIILSIVLWICLWGYRLYHQTNYGDISKAIQTIVIMLFLVLPIVYFYYKSNPTFQENIRFAYEGFFSLVEKGEWNVRSNRMLESMIIWPDNLKTWLIGDGYFNSPNNDITYIGKSYDYYMGTDVGYCRFIFYFGLLGLGLFSLFFIKTAATCSKNNPQYAIVFWMILLLNFIVWIKVSSDIFSVFALFLFVNEKDLELKNDVA